MLELASNMQKKTIGVTGAAGFIGSHLCQRLLKDGFKVIAVDNFSKGTQGNIKNLKSSSAFRFKKMDLLNVAKVKTIFKDVDVVIHLAAAKIPRYGGRSTTLITNTRSTENILEAAKVNKPKVIFISTSDVYGKNPGLPFAEDADLVLGSSKVARWAYAVSKIFDEHLCFSYWEEYQVPFTVIRLFGVYGPKQHRTWWGGPQALFIDRILKGEEVEIHGDGKQTRTFIYIDDVVDAIIKSIQSSKANNQIINIGTSEEISIIDLARLIAEISSKKLKIKKITYNSFTGKTYEDVRRRVPNLAKAKDLLGWEPKISLREGLEKTIDWHLQNKI